MACDQPMDSKRFLFVLYITMYTCLLKWFKVFQVE